MRGLVLSFFAALAVTGVVAVFLYWDQIAPPAPAAKPDQQAPVAQKETPKKAGTQQSPGGAGGGSLSQYWDRFASACQPGAEPAIPQQDAGGSKSGQRPSAGPAPARPQPKAGPATPADAFGDFLARQEPPAPPTTPAQTPEDASATPEAAPKPEEPPPQPARRMAPPRVLAGVRFGVSAAEIARRFPPAWTKETAEALTLVHHFDRAKTREARFDFTAKGLRSVELRFQAPDKKAVGPLYEKLQKQAHEQYGSLPGSTNTRWTDGETAARIERGPTYVSLIFQPAKE